LTELRGKISQTYPFLSVSALKTSKKGRFEKSGFRAEPLQKRAGLRNPPRPVSQTSSFLLLSELKFQKTGWFGKSSPHPVEKSVRSKPVLANKILVMALLVILKAKSISSCKFGVCRAST